MKDERFIPGTSRITEIESFHRYLAAAELCRGKRVLDVASGEGYGSNFLAAAAREVVGLDICREAVEAAHKKYRKANLSFVCGDAYAMPFEPGEFDCAVSFETIEHLEDPERLLAELRRVLGPSGFVILSSPNKTVFDRRNRCENGENVFHKREMESDELIALMKHHFPNTRVYSQDSFFSSQIGGDSAMRYFVKSAGTIIRQEALSKTQYSIVLGGSGELPELSPSSYVDADFDERFGYQPDDEAVVNQFGLRGDYERACAELETVRREAEQTLSKACAEGDKARAERDAANRDLDNEKAARAATQQALSKACAEGDKARAERDAANRDLDNEKAARAATQQALDVCRAEGEKLLAKLESECKALGELRTEHAALEKTLSSVRAENAGAQKALAAEQKAHGELRSRYSRQEKALAESRAEGVKRQKELDAARKAQNELHDRYARQEKALADARTESEKRQKELDAAHKTHNELQAKFAAQEKLLGSAQADGIALRHELTAAHNAQNLLRAQCAALGKSLAESRAESAERQKELDGERKALGELRTAFAALRTERDAVGRELDATRRRLAASDADAAQLRSTLEETRNADAARIADLERQLAEVNAKAEYLWREYEELKRAWSLRIFGRFQLRKRAERALQNLGRKIHGCGKRVVNALGVRYETRFKWKNALYPRFGRLLGAVDDYREWLKRDRRRVDSILRPGAGLDVPADLPMTSIIIPVYNNLKYTLPCLHSIYSVGSRAPFEVIVVDDCSTEDYTTVLRREYPQVRVIRNEKNSGFLLTVNRGAKEARGEYVLILNNDTEVLPGWLDELATCLYHHPEAGMIGSQLIHMRTGTLQESGDLVCRDGRMLPLGRGSDPDHPEFSYFREVDFASAASIILRKRVFEEMGGFDVSYAPAYFEDPDLGLRLQRAGYHNYVMPLSRVMHMEMASYGDALDERCERNRKFFCDRWRDYLARHAVYDSPEDFNACRKFPRERILYIDAEMPMADRGSGGMDAIFFMNYFLKRNFEVVFHGEYTPGGVPKYTEILLRMGVECVYLPHRKIWEYLESNGWTFSWLFISRIYQAQCFDRLLKKYCPQARYIFDTVDLHFVREQLEADLHDVPRMHKQAARTKEFELAVARSADATIVISRDEKKLLDTEYGLTNVWHIPQARAIAGRKEGVKRSGAVFIGSAHPPNLDGLRYFHDEILPLLPKTFRLTIIGEALRDAIGKTPEYRDLLKCRQFRFAGFVRELGDELDHALLSIAPLRYGAGTKGKVASSMSYGVPCVSSDFGVEGTGMIHERNILLAHTPEEFASAITRLCTDPELWKNISDGGLEFLRNEYDPAKVEAEMDELFASVRRNARPDKENWSKTPVIPKQEELPELE